MLKRLFLLFLASVSLECAAQNDTLKFRNHRVSFGYSAEYIPMYSELYFQKIWAPTSFAYAYMFQNGNGIQAEYKSVLHRDDSIHTMTRFDLVESFHRSFALSYLRAFQFSSRRFGLEVSAGGIYRIGYEWQFDTLVYSLQHPRGRLIVKGMDLKGFGLKTSLGIYYPIAKWMRFKFVSELQWIANKKEGVYTNDSRTGNPYLYFEPSSVVIWNSLNVEFLF